MTEREEMLELYKVVVDTITNNEQRRQQLASVFLSLIAAGIALIGSIQNLDPIYVVVPALFISAVWLLSVDYFKRLAQAKFKVIAEIESHFSLRPFELEWKHFKGRASDSPGADIRFRRLRLGLTQLELIVPSLLGLASLTYVVYRAASMIGWRSLIC